MAYGGYVTLLVCQMIVQDDVTKFYGKGSLKVSCHHTKFDSHRHFGSRDTMFLVCYVMPQDHMIKRSCDFMGMNPLW